MLKEKLVKGLQWCGFVGSVGLIVVVASQTFEEVERALPFLFALVPFIVVVFIRYKVTGKNLIFPWMDD